MTASELAEALSRLDDPGFKGLVARFGGGFTERRQLVDHFVGNPGHERQLAHLLGLHTESDKLLEAAQRSAAASERSAAAADKSAHSSRFSMIWAGLGVIVSLVALALATRAVQ